MSEILEQQTIGIRVPCGIQGAATEEDISITQKALEVINNIRLENNVPEGLYLRMGTRGGGCGGMTYTLGFDSEFSDSDRFFETSELNLVIDAKSLFYLAGITLDYTEGVHGSGFIFHGLNNMPTCGCGA